MKKNNQSVNSIIEAAHAKAWAGKHQQVIDLTTQELSKRNLPTSMHMDLLNLRAESYIAHGKFDMALEDALSMETLSKSVIKSHAVKAQALIAKGTVQLRRGDYKEAVKSIKTALVSAKQAKNKALIGQSFLLLSQTYYQLWESAKGIRNAQQAIAIFQELNDVTLLGRSYRSLASLYFGQKQTEKALSTARTALELGEQAGDQYGIGNALNTIASQVTDLGESIRLLQRAVQIYTSIENSERNIISIGNLAFSYMLLGLYTRARRLQKEVIETARIVGAKGRLTFELGNLIYTDIFTNKIDDAKLHLAEFSSLVNTEDDPGILKDITETKAKLAFAQKDWANAKKFFEEALQINDQFGLSYKIDIVTNLAHVHLASGKPEKALKFSTKATNWHREESYPLIDTITSQEIWWRHTQILNANHRQKEAQESLQIAHNFLIEGIRNIQDVGLRRNYLNKVAENREILQHWVVNGKKQKFAEEKRHEHLTLSSNTREPFTRLTDTSQRLNLLKDISDIKTFLVEEATELCGGERVMLILEDGKKLEVAESILPVGEEADNILPSIKKHLSSARLTRTVQLILPKKQGLSRIIAPLIAQNQVIGYLYADMDSVYGLFDDTDRDMLGMLANQAAVALDNVGLVVGLEQKVNERTQQLQESMFEAEQLLKESITLAEVGRDISSSLDTTTVLENIALYAKELMTGDLSAIFLPEENGNILRAIAAVGKDADELRNDIIELGKGILGSVAKKKAPEIVNFAINDPRALAIKGTEISVIEHMLIVPLLVGGELQGLMAVWRIGGGEEFVSSDLNLLNNLSQQAVIALKNAQLFTEAEQARAEAELASKTKSAFLANMSHELRTPLNAIINFNHLVSIGAMGPVNAEQVDVLGHSLTSSQHLLQLINDVLDISKIQAGKLSMFMEDNVVLHREISEVFSMIEPLLKKNADLYDTQVALVKDIDDNLPLIRCDRRRLKQILLNLLTNAVKFTQAGTITLSVKHKGDYIAFAVMDTGLGISKEMQSHIFDPFVQTVDGTKVEGTGLGLPITKSLIEAHSGKLWLESEVGEGSAFFFTLPVEVSA